VDVGKAWSPEREMKRKSGEINTGDQKRKVVVTSQEAMADMGSHPSCHLSLSFLKIFPHRSSFR
jgi:hypothetical protein